ncbi:MULTISPECIES: hypothetical protein [Lysobacter]|jgi:hypothetical protein|uniref:hypothetical protein n=1 Tax=Lysobacter TaxID=68 RepID=UPI001F46A337|nr:MULTISPECIES: hypothetical protein [Lysobacter]UJB18760.1 hypothetical protein L1A79_20960 [Lysobacter capsici]UJQ27515.1 hypothetical protein L2D09_18925 [Lysobacter gummosus]
MAGSGSVIAIDQDGIDPAEFHDAGGDPRCLRIRVGRVFRAYGNGMSTSMGRRSMKTFN